MNFSKKIIFLDEVHFHLDGYVNTRHRDLASRFQNPGQTFKQNRQAIKQYEIFKNFIKLLNLAILYH